MCSGETALPVLLHVATEGLGRRGAVLAGVLVSDTSPGGLVASFYGRYPGGADGESSGGMELTYKRLDTWEIVGTEGFE